MIRVSARDTFGVINLWRYETDLLIVKRAIQETITDSKIPELQAETHPLNDFRYRCFQYIIIYIVVSYVRLFELVYITQE